MNAPTNHRTKILVGLNIIVLVATVGLAVGLWQAGGSTTPATPTSSNSADVVAAEVPRAAEQQEVNSEPIVVAGPERQPAEQAEPAEPKPSAPTPEPEPTPPPTTDAPDPQPDPDPDPPVAKLEPTVVKLAPITVTRTSACPDDDTFCSIIFPTVFITFTSGDGETTTLDNGNAVQTVTAEGEPVTVFEAAQFPYSEGWTMAVFVRDDWSGRSTRANSSTSSLIHTRIAEANGNAELVVQYRIDTD